MIVTEPTLSGEHDLKRVYELVNHFGVLSIVCVNKFDLNREMSSKILRCCSEKGIPVVGEIPYDVEVAKAQVAGTSVVEFGNGPAAKGIRNSWEEVLKRLEERHSE